MWAMYYQVGCKGFAGQCEGSMKTRCQWVGRVLGPCAAQFWQRCMGVMHQVLCSRASSTPIQQLGKV